VILLPGALVLMSFLVGMFKDIVLRAKILGYGATTAIGGPLVLAVLVYAGLEGADFVCTAFDYIFIIIGSLGSLKSKPKQKDKQKGPEDNPAIFSENANSQVLGLGSGNEIESKDLGTNDINTAADGDHKRHDGALDADDLQGNGPRQRSDRNQIHNDGVDKMVPQAS
jgi:hypothetical protein